MAASCAVHYAKKGRKVLYLNLEQFGSSDLFFDAEGQFDMSDVIFALKSKKANLAIKLESCVKQDVSGVYFYSQTKNPLDMLELNMEEKTRLISEIKLSGVYDIIIVDADFGVDSDNLKFLKLAEIWRFKQFLEQNNLRSPLGCLPDQSVRLCKCFLRIPAAAHLGYCYLYISHRCSLLQKDYYFL